MTEEEWLSSVSPQKMIAAVTGKGSARLWRLFAVACARRVECFMRDKRSRIALEVAERYADGAATTADLATARYHAEGALHWARYEQWVDEVRANFTWDAGQAAAHEATCAAEAALQCVAEDIGNTSGGQATLIADALQLPDVIREVFGNPFRWPHIDPACLAWNDRQVVRLAEGIYDERAFDRMPILADALEEAGCTEAALLDHLRSPGPHVRGCFAVDLCLNKS
jgi:hypothetical protein